VVFGLQLHRLFLASFVHTHLPSLFFSVWLCWSRFACLEANWGTLGFLVWFFFVSLVIHGTYCFATLTVGTIFDPTAGTGEVKGLYPLIVANFVVSARESADAQVWLWPLPLHVSMRAVPAVVIALTWLLHWEAHYDVLVAYVLATVLPNVVEPDLARLTDSIEKTAIGGFVVSWLQGFDSFVCRPPYLGSYEDSAQLSKKESWSETSLSPPLPSPPPVSGVAALPVFSVGAAVSGSTAASTTALDELL